MFYLLVIAIIPLLCRGNDVPRIVGGDDVPYGKYPFVVRLIITSVVANTPRTGLCGGSIVSKREILTAAHCLESPQSGLAVQVNVNIGNRDNNDQDEANEQFLTAIGMIIHEGWNSQTLENDIALIILQDDIVFSENVAPIDLPTVGQIFPAGTACTVIGWGLTDGVNGATILQELAYETVAIATCQQAYSYLKDGMLCTGIPPMDEKRAASGDSGGPVFATQGEPATPVQIGLVSFGKPENAVGTNDYDVNADVAFYSDWLEYWMHDYDKAGTMFHMEADDTLRTAVVAKVTRYQLQVWSITPRDADHKVRVSISVAPLGTDQFYLIEGLVWANRQVGKIFFKVDGGQVVTDFLATSHSADGIMTLEAVTQNTVYPADHVLLTVKYWQVPLDQYMDNCPFGTTYQAGSVLDDKCVLIDDDENPCPEA